MLTYEGPDTHYSLTELAALALEVAQDEGLDLDTALDRAAAQLDELRWHALDWDSMAWCAGAGNWNVDARVIPF